MNFRKYMTGKAFKKLVYYVIVFVAGIFIANGWGTEAIWDVIMPGIVAAVFGWLGIDEDLPDEDVDVVNTEE